MTDTLSEFHDVSISVNPVDYRLRKLENGGVELLAGFEVTQSNGPVSKNRIDWRVVKTLEVGEMPDDNGLWKD